MKALLGIAVLAGLLAVVPAESTEPAQYASELPLDRGSAGLWQTLRKLQTRASLMMITAHPDDEDGGMLAYHSRGRGARAAILCLTRGEGGANVMSDDYFDALGLVRTEELLAADRYYGVEQYWARVTDYGFSKTKEEALEKWGHDRVLHDAVRAVRLFRPLILASVFIGGATDGHGNHQTTGQIAQEVFAAAGDPNAFPEQLKEGLRPWSPLKTYGRVPGSLAEGRVDPKGLYNYATMRWGPAGYQNYIENKWTPGALPTTVEIPSGEYDPVLGLNYVQIAREGLGLQKCQNGGPSIPPPGEVRSAYHRFGSRVTAGERETSFFDGVDISLEGIATLAGKEDAAFLKHGLSQIGALAQRALQDFDGRNPERIAPTLAAGLKASISLIDQVTASGLSAQAKYDILHELSAKRDQFNSAVARALGLSMLATVAPDKPVDPRFAMFRGMPETFQVAIPGQRFTVGVHLTNQGSVPVQLAKVWLQGQENANWQSTPEAPPAGALENNKPLVVRMRTEVPVHLPLTKPYFTRPHIEQAWYDVEDARFANMSHRPYPLAAWAELTYEGAAVRIGQVVQTVKRLTGPGTVLEPLVVGPAISLSIAPRAGIIPLDAAQFQVSATVRSNVKGPAKGELRLRLPDGWHSSPASAGFSTERDGEEQTVTFRVQPASLQPKEYDIKAVASYGGREYVEGYHTVGYVGLRPYNLYAPSTYRASGVDVKVAPSLAVGYITGSGDEVPQALENLGIKVNFLTDQDLATTDLSRYGVILLGVRTYAVREALKATNSRLLDYVKNGGVMIVQYNTPEFDLNYGPYPYQMTQSPEEVTYENSPMQVLVPDNPLFTWPNKITSADFEGWVEERGSKFMKTWDPRYQALLETHDPNQEPQKGGLLYATYGKGVYIYCAYAFYRQLPNGVPGAYRLFANLISLPSNPQARQKSGTSHL
jgi:LmbE family N-acetylglucosaminyl deacetylase